jgi:hypothetical protein
MEKREYEILEGYGITQGFNDFDSTHRDVMVIDVEEEK